MTYLFASFAISKKLSRRFRYRPDRMHDHGACLVFQTCEHPWTPRISRRR